mmetsp:Transcript_21078/g.71859  ORF Transcript_21078/g.71859 Transcript_21078/m.71859 type:complete len:226 (-) Transcript_21078:205-882(-)
MHAMPSVSTSGKRLGSCMDASSGSIIPMPSKQYMNMPKSIGRCAIPVEDSARLPRAASAARSSLNMHSSPYALRASAAIEHGARLERLLTQDSATSAGRSMTTTASELPREGSAACTFSPMKTRYAVQKPVWESTRRQDTRTLPGLPSAPSATSLYVAHAPGGAAPLRSSAARERLRASTACHAMKATATRKTEPLNAPLALKAKGRPRMPAPMKAMNTLPRALP